MRLTATVASNQHGGVILTLGGGRYGAHRVSAGQQTPTTRLHVHARGYWEVNGEDGAEGAAKVETALAQLQAEAAYEADREAAEHAPLTAAESRTHVWLNAILNSQDKTAWDIGNCAARSATTARRHLKRLEEEGLVERLRHNWIVDALGRRAVAWALTFGGEEEYEILDERALHQENRRRDRRRGSQA